MPADIGDVVPTVGGEAAADRQELFRQNGRGDTIPGRGEQTGQRFLRLTVRLAAMQVRGRYNGCHVPAVPAELKAYMRLRRSDDDDRTGILQFRGRAEDEAAEVFPVEVLIVQAVTAARFDIFAQISQAIDGQDTRPITLLFQVPDDLCIKRTSHFRHYD